MELEKKFTREEIEGRNTRKNTVIIIDNVVYDVTEFLEDHPGGTDVLLDNGGKDASRCFHAVGHSELALEWRQQFRLGELVAADQREVRAPPAPPAPPPAAALTLSALLDVWAPPLALAVLAALCYVYLF